MLWISHILWKAHNQQCIQKWKPEALLSSQDPHRGSFPPWVLNMLYWRRINYATPYVSWVSGLLWKKITWESSSGHRGWNSYVTFLEGTKSPMGKFPSLNQEGWTILFTRMVYGAQKAVQTTLVISSLIYRPKPNIPVLYLHKPNVLLCKKHKGCPL